MPDVSKSVAQYTANGSEAEHCGICKHFRAPRACRIVMGSIELGGWCKYWTRLPAARPVEDAEDAVKGRMEW